jgi:hypothetical protein
MVLAAATPTTHGLLNQTAIDSFQGEVPLLGAALRQHCPEEAPF